MKDKPNKVTAILKVVVTGEFYDDDSTEETLRYTIEQDLEDAGFEVDVSPLKEQEPKSVRIDEGSVHCPSCGNELFTYPRQKYCDECGQAVRWT